MQDVSRQIGSYIFNYRAAALIERRQKYLFVTLPHIDYWFLPGGRVKSGESAAETLLREMQEELGLTVTVKSLRWVVENFFAQKTLQFHEIGFYFQVSLPQDAGDVWQKSFYRQPESQHFQWFSLDETQSLNVQPEFLKSRLWQPAQGIEHIVFRDGERVS